MTHKANQHPFGPGPFKHQAASRAQLRLIRAELYLDRARDALKEGDPIHALSNAAELAEIARRLCNDCQQIIESQSPPKKPQT